MNPTIFLYLQKMIVCNIKMNFLGVCHTIPQIVQDFSLFFFCLLCIFVMIVNMLDLY